MKYKNSLLLLTAVCSLPQAGTAQKQKKAKATGKLLNVVYIMTDDHSYQAVSAYGHPIGKLAPTPNIDRLASEGVLFRKAFVENSLSTPSRACLMTGLYSHQNEQRTLDKGIDTTKVFVSELLQSGGYQTAVIGKWHMQCEPKGFDYYAVFNDQGEYYNPGFKTKESRGEYIREEGYATHLVTDHAIDYLEHRDRKKPFTLFVHHKAPHRNWMPEEKYLNLYEEVEFPLPETFYDDYKTRCAAAFSQEMEVGRDLQLIYDLKLNNPDSLGSPNDRAGWEPSVKRMNPDQWKAWKAAYGPRNKEFNDRPLTGDALVRWKYQRYMRDYLRCIKTVDDEVGRLVAYLEKNGLLENTVIIYTSDQGFYNGEHGWFDKRFMYEESFRTPLIIRYPGKTKGGTVNDELVQNIDYAPTLLAIVGVEKPESFVGRSLVSLAKGEEPADWRQYLYYHYYDYPAVHQVRRHDGVRDDRYKLIHFYGEGFGKDKGNTIDCNEFYDLQADPNELNNLYGQPAYQSIIDRLQAQLDRFRGEQKVDEY